MVGLVLERKKDTGSLLLGHYFALPAFSKLPWRVHKVGNALVSLSLVSPLDRRETHAPPE